MHFITFSGFREIRQSAMGLHFPCEREIRETSPTGYDGIVLLIGDAEIPVLIVQ